MRVSTAQLKRLVREVLLHEYVSSHEKDPGTMAANKDQRKEILEALKGVVRVEWVDDTDETVCEALRRIKPTYFANGGDRKGDNVPEVAVCQELGIEMLWNMGGSKIESSSDLVNKANLNNPQGKATGNGAGKHSEK